MPKKSPPAKVGRSPGTVIVVRRDSTTGKRVTTISGSNSENAAKLAERLLKVLKSQDETPDSRLFFVSFSEAPSRGFRAAVVKNIKQKLVDSADEDNPLSENNLRWPRLIVPARSGPSFALLSLHSESNWYCGFWLNPTTLVLGDLYLDAWSPLEGVSAVSAAHWHPDSMTSGCWRDHYAVLGDGIDVEWSLKDEDGTHIVFRRAPGNSPAEVAKRLAKGVASWYIFGAETDLLTAYFLGFSRGNIAWLRTNENSGYEIDEFSLRADEDVMRELKRLNPPPTQEEASLWLEVTEHDVTSSEGEYWTTSSDPAELILALRGIAEGVDYADFTS